MMSDSKAANTNLSGQQKQPGRQSEMSPQPEIIRDDYKGCEKLKGKIALITGGDSGIGRSVAVHFAREGASVAIIYLEEDKDALETKKLVEAENQKCLVIKGDLKDSEFCKKAVKKCIDTFGKLNILVNNAAMQFSKNALEEISRKQIETVFATNIFSIFEITKAALPHL